jgi:hypothetical protein
LLARLPDADAALERTRLFGSAISVGIVDVVLTSKRRGRSASRTAPRVPARREFSLGAAEAGEWRSKGLPIASTCSTVAGLRVIDYKSGSGPNPRRALQVPIYALCAQERLAERDAAMADRRAAYVAFSGKRP